MLTKFWWLRLSSNCIHSFQIRNRGWFECFANMHPMETLLGFLSTLKTKGFDNWCTVEPQSYGLHRYGKLGQPDTEIEYIFGKYHIKWEQVIKFSSVTQSFSFNISKLVIIAAHSSWKMYRTASNLEVS